MTALRGVMIEGILLMVDRYSEGQGFSVCGGGWLVHTTVQSCMEVRVELKKDDLEFQGFCGG